MRRDSDGLAFGLGFDQGLEPLLELVAILPGVEVGGESIHQLFGQFYFLRIQLGFVVLAILRYGGDFIAVEHGMKREPLFARPDKDGVLALVHGEFGDAHAVGIFERLGQQAISLGAGRFRDGKVGSVEIDWIDLALIDKSQNVHGLSGNRGDLFDLLGLDQHVLAFFVLVAFHDLGSLHVTITGGAKKRLLEPGMTFGMKLVKRDPAGTGRGV